MPIITPSRELRRDKSRLYPKKINPQMAMPLASAPKPSIEQHGIRLIIFYFFEILTFFFLTKNHFRTYISERRFSMPLLNAASQCRFSMPLLNAASQCRFSMPLEERKSFFIFY
jgi:hypothetical protein